MSHTSITTQYYHIDTSLTSSISEANLNGRFRGYLVASKGKTTVQSRLKILAAQVGGTSALAGLLGIHRGTLYDYISGVREVPSARLEKIAAMYPCDLEWLVKGVGEPPQPSAARTLEAKAAVRAAAGKSISPEVGVFGLGPRPGLTLPASMARRGRQVRLEAARERVLELMKMYESDEIKKVLGQALFDEVQAGRACPSSELLFRLAEALRVRAGWVLGLEDS